MTVADSKMYSTDASGMLVFFANAKLRLPKREVHELCDHQFWEGGSVFRCLKAGSGNRSD